MVSKRELEERVAAKHKSMVAAYEERDAERRRADRLASALERVARHYGFHDAYLGEVKESVLGFDFAFEAPVRYVTRFTPDKLIKDLDAIDQARSADEARTRLGIGDGREGE